MCHSSVGAEPPKTGILGRVKLNISARQTPSKPVERSGAVIVAQEHSKTRERCDKKKQGGEQGKHGSKRREKGRKEVVSGAPPSPTSRYSFCFSGARKMYPTPSRNRRAQAKSEERLQSAVPSPMVTDLSARMSGPSSPTDPGANPGSAGPFRGRSRSHPEPPRSNAAIMAEGGTRNLDEMYLKVSQPGDRRSSAFLTWSSARSGGHWQSPRDRKAFAQKLGIVADQVRGWTHAKKKVTRRKLHCVTD